MPRPLCGPHVVMMQSLCMPDPVRVLMRICCAIAHDSRLAHEGRVADPARAIVPQKWCIKLSGNKNYEHQTLLRHIVHLYLKYIVICFEMDFW